MVAEINFSEMKYALMPKSTNFQSFLLWIEHPLARYTTSAMEHGGCKLVSETLALATG